MPSLLERITLDGLTPARLWADLGDDVRREAAEAVYRGEPSADHGRRETDAAIAGRLRFREVAVRRLPVERRIHHVVRTLRPDDGLASTLLLALHLERRKAVLSAFLDRLGIEHEDGAIRDDVDPPGSEALADAAAALYERFPREQVDLYLATLVAMEPETWGGLTEFLRARASDAPDQSGSSTTALP